MTDDIPSDYYIMHGREKAFCVQRDKTVHVNYENGSYTCFYAEQFKQMLADGRAALATDKEESR